MVFKKGHKINLGRKRPDMIKNQFSKGNIPNKTSFKKGHKTWIKGLTKKTDKRVKKLGEKTSKTRKKLFKERKLVGPNKNKKLSEEHKQHLKENHWSKRDGYINPNKGKVSKRKNKTYEEIYDIEKAKKLKEDARKRRAKQVFPTTDTKIELKIQNFLKQLGIEFFTHQYIKQIEHAYQCDIFIPLMNLVIECDGDYWHSYPTGTEIDHIRTKELIDGGFKVLRLWEFEIKKLNVNDFEDKIRKFK